MSSSAIEAEHEIQQRVVAAQQRIAEACARVQRDPAEVEIVGITKTHGPEVVRTLWEAGVRLLGENRVQEATVKIPQCIGGPSWHLVGHLQRNKVRLALEFFSVIHSVDSIRLLEQIEQLAETSGHNPEILLEVNVSGESSKNGLAPQDVPSAVEHALACRSLTLTGLMTMAPFVSEAEQARPVFARLRKLRDTLEQRFSVGLPKLSMGMSNDFEIAVEEGATWLRLGTVLLGTRSSWRCRRLMTNEFGAG